MTDETHPQPMGGPAPQPPSRGTFLPSMRWTEDKDEVEQEKQRLLALQEHLNQAMAHAIGTDECATWWMMADASLHQLDKDLGDLYDWLERSERGAQREGRGAPD